MSYDYDRTAGIIDTASKAAEQRINALVKASTALEALGRRGVKFDERDAKKLKVLRNHILDLGEASEKAARRLYSHKEANEVTADILDLLDQHLGDWSVARTTQLTERDESTPMRIFNGNATLGAVALLNIAVIDFARAVKHNDPDMVSVRDTVMRRLQ